MPRLFISPGGVAIGRPGYGYGRGYGRGGLGAAVVIFVLILIIIVVATSRGSTAPGMKSQTWSNRPPRPGLATDQGLGAGYTQGFTSNDPAVQPDPDSYVPITKPYVRPSNAPLTRPY
jgi:hypothetical protein